MARYLITGGAGFIGSNLARKLVSMGEEVTILDDFSTGRQANLADIQDRIRVIRGDICVPAAVAEAMKGAEYVLHHAAAVSVERSINEPGRTNRINIEGTLNCLIAARDEGVRRFVFAASSSAYGDSAELPKQEDMKADPLSPYAVSKLAGEMYCKIFHHVYHLPTVSLRYFNVFGPYQDPSSQYAAVIPIFITRLLEGRRPIVYGDGEQSRDFTYIDNAIDANLSAIGSKKALGRVINVACGTRFTLNELLERLRGLTGSDLKADYAEARAGDVRHSEGDITAARDLLDYRPRVSFSEGLRRTVEWYKAASGASST